MARPLVSVLVLVLLAPLCGNDASGSTVIIVKPGRHVILPCQSDDVNIRAVEWTRSDLDPEYVLLYRDGHSDPTNQHSSFRGRVQLVDKDLKTGDVSLILRNVSRNDSGTYECRVEAGGSSPQKTGLIDNEPIHTVRLQVSDSGSTVILVKPGQDVILKCQSDDVNIIAAKWTRPDLVGSEYVLLYRDGRSDPTNQHLSFRGRVQLVDKDLKTGDVSLILKNVSRNDSGTYECRVAAGGSRRQKRGLNDNEPVCTFQLQVSDSGKQQSDEPDKEQPDGDQNRGTPHLYTGLGTAAGLVGLVVVVGLFLAWKRKKQPDHRPEPSSEPLSPSAEDVQV